MATQAWDETPADLRPSGKRRLAAIGRWFLGLFVIAALTFGAAFYLPLHRAHRALTAEHAALMDKHRKLDGELSRVRGELASSQSARAALQSQSDEATAKMSAQKARLDASLADAREKLQKLIDRKVLSVELRDERVVLSFAPALAEKLEALPAPKLAAQLGLCEITKALSSSTSPRTFDVIAYAGAAAAEAPADKWDVPSKRAHRVAEALESKCQLPAAQTSATVRGAPSASNAPLEIVVDEG